MNQREKLIELIRHRRYSYDNILGIDCGTIADHLLANGVVVLPCKLGDTVYVIEQSTKEICQGKVLEFSITRSKDQKLQMEIEFFSIFNRRQYLTNNVDSLWNKTVFLTPEEAESALREMTNV